MSENITNGERLNNFICQLNTLDFVIDIIDQEGTIFIDGCTLIFDFWLLDDSTARSFYDEVLSAIDYVRLIEYDDMDENEQEDVDDSGDMQFTVECIIETKDNYLALIDNLDFFLNKQNSTNKNEV